MTRRFDSVVHYSIIGTLQPRNLKHYIKMPHETATHQGVLEKIKSNLLIKSGVLNERI